MATTKTKDRVERLLEGAHVAIHGLRGDEAQYNGRYGAVIRVNYTPDGARDARSGDPDLARHAEVESYTVRLRDEASTILQVNPENAGFAHITQFQRTIG